MDVKRSLLGISAAALLALGAPALSYADDDDRFERRSHREFSHRHHHDHYRHWGNGPHRGWQPRHGWQQDWRGHGRHGNHWRDHRNYDHGYRHGFRHGGSYHPWSRDDLTIIYRGHF